jgi:predicted metal-dependent peptidase
MKNKKEKLKPYQEAWHEIRENYLLGVVTHQIRLIPSRSDGTEIIFNKNSFGYLDIIDNNEASLFINKEAKLNKEDWYFIFATVAIILGLDLYKKLLPENDSGYNILKENAIFLFAINYVYSILELSMYPKEWSTILKIKDEISFKNESAIYEQLQDNHTKQSLIPFNLMVDNKQSIFLQKAKNKYGHWHKDFAQMFAENLIEQAKKTIALRTNRSISKEDLEKQNTEGYKAKRWFINHYPLLSALASQFEIVEDIKLCQRNSIEIGAVSTVEKIIFINPLAGLNEQGMRFVIAHEILHIALNHMSRRQGRDHVTWNVACDFVINYWLITMNVGVPPSNIFMDKDLAGKSADEIYIMINQDVRLKKKLGTLRDSSAGTKTNKTACDMLDDDVRYFGEFEDACKEALLRGMFLHETIGRGDLPADLIEEIKLINQPSIPWQVNLARWIAERFPLEESKKTYARPSRRQSATPDIPRARYIRPNEDKMTQTFGVLLDTSASMNKELLGKCLGAIASYAATQEVKYIRLVFCDAQPYDEGYVPIEILSQKLKVKGRGGTELQQAVNYLENIHDFPKEAPILILTDGGFESDLKINRDHAFLVPNKASLPIIPKGEVFEFK